MKDRILIILQMLFIVLAIISCNANDKKSYNGIKAKQYNTKTVEADLKEMDKTDRKIVAAVIEVYAFKPDALVGRTYGEIIDTYEGRIPNDNITDDPVKEFDLGIFLKTIESKKKAVIPIEKLAYYHKDNLFLCDKNFNKKSFWVSGEIKEFGKTDADVPLIYLNTKEYYIYHGAAGVIDDNNSTKGVNIETLHKGDRITLFGKCYLDEDRIWFMPAIVSKGEDENLLIKAEVKEDSIN